MREAFEKRGGHLCVAVHGRPFAEVEVGGDDDGRAFVEPANEVEQELSTGLLKGGSRAHQGSGSRGGRAERRCGPSG